MKIKKIKKGKIKLINLGLIKTPNVYYKKKHFNSYLRKDFTFRLKNALNIIFKFHSENKKILFLGTPIKLNKQFKDVLKNTNHSFIPEKIWLNGILTNTKSIFKFLFKKFLKKNKNNLKFLFNLIHKNNLVVIINESFSVNSLRELTKKRIPTISLNYCDKYLNSQISTYRVKKIYKSNYLVDKNNLFLKIITTTLKKAEKLRFKNIKYSFKQRKIRRNNKRF